MTVAGRAAGTNARGPDWAAMLSAACRHDVVTSAYQPIVDVARGSAVGYEALARFAGYAEGPEDWFAAAREHGCHAALEAVALRSALARRAELPQNCFLTVNVSPDVLASPEIRAVWRAEADLDGVVVEITEQARIDSYAAIEGDLAALRSAGALIAVDDAGAGYAGLQHLLALRPAIIKLDRQLVENVDVDEAKLALVEMIGTFAGRVDAWLLAEGIERAGELDALAALGVPLAQGYYLARPGPPWVGLNPDAVLRLVSRRPTGTADSVRDLVELTATAGTVTAAAAMFADDHTRVVVVVDEHARPVSLLSPDAVGFGVAERGMRVNLDTPVRDALLRAITRAQDQRYDPLMCTDNAGRHLGVVRVERMIHAVLGD